jgi:hypothetical protein
MLNPAPLPARDANTQHTRTSLTRPLASKAARLAGYSPAATLNTSATMRTSHSLTTPSASALARLLADALNTTLLHELVWP